MRGELVWGVEDTRAQTISVVWSKMNTCLYDLYIIRPSENIVYYRLHEIILCINYKYFIFNWMVNVIFTLKLTQILF